jgi:hypothetical protein
VPGRSRTIQYGNYTSGTRKRKSDGQLLTSAYPQGNSTCIDFVGDPFNDHTLLIERKRVNKVGTLSGTTSAYIWTNYPYTNQPEAAAHYAIIGSAPSPTAAATDVIARTNPSRPEVSMPNFIAELRELPGMLYQAGAILLGSKKALKRKGNSAVESNFGWDLLIKDLWSIINFADQVDKRVIELTNLHKKGGLKRKRVVWSQVQEGSTPTTFHTLDAGITGQVLWRTYGRRWVTVRWKPDIPDLPSAQELLRTARSTVHGWDFSAGGISSAAWNAFPWSWFADYFGNVGSMLAARRNSVGAHVASCCVMTYQQTTGKHVISSVTGGVTVVPNSSEYTTIQRELGAIGLSSTVPFLGTKQLVTLSSIALNYSGI